MTGIVDVRLGQLLNRFGVPGPIVSLVCYVRYRAAVSPRAEVEVTRNLKLGRKCVISSFSKLKSSDGPLSIGAGSSIASSCFIASHSGGLTIGDDVMVGPNCSIVAVNYEYRLNGVPIKDQTKTSKGIVIGSDVWIGSNCTILDGAQIGDGAIVSPGTVVSGKVRSNVIVAGNPPKELFRRR